MSARVCVHCGEANDETRVFCANCGTRLPESTPAAPAAPTLKARSQPAGKGITLAPPSVGASAPPVSVYTNPKRKKPDSAVSGGSFFGQILFLVVIAAGLAAVIQMTRLPEGIPAPVGVSVAATQQSFLTLRSSAMSANPSSWMITENGLNQFLETTVVSRTSDQPPSALKAEFVRVFVALGNGDLQFGMEQKFLGQRFFFLLHVIPESSAGGTTARIAGASIGHLPVHPEAAKYLLKLYQPTLDALADPLSFVAKAVAVQIRPDDATLKWPGTINSR